MGTGAPLPQAIRAAAVATGVDGRIFLAGGFDDTGSGQLATAYALGLDGGWTALPAAVVTDGGPGPGWETSGDIGADGKFYVFGGEGEDVTDAGVVGSLVNARTLIYDPTANTWSLGAPMPERRRQHRALRGSDGNFYIIGGETAASAASNTVFVYHPTTNSWTTGPSLAIPIDGGADSGIDAGSSPVPVNSFAAATTPDRGTLIIAGGSNNDGNGSAPYFSDVYLFDVGTQTWSKYPTPLPVGRRELAGVFGTCSLHILGGTSGIPVTEHDVVQLLAGTTEVCNGKDDNCNGQIDEGAICSGATGSRCVTDTSTHCGCATGGDCAVDQTCNTTTHLCEGGGDGGSDGGPGSDGGGGLDASSGDDGGGAGSDGGASDGGDSGGGGSSGCGCSLVGGDAPGGLAALAGLGVVAAITARARRRRR